MATKIITAYGNAQIDTAQKVFGTASGFFDGNGDYIDTPDSEDFNVGSGDFTVDFWFRRTTASSATQYLCGQVDSALSVGSRSILFYFTGANKLFAIVRSVSGDYKYVETIFAPSTSVWYHAAFVRYGNTLSLYLNGSLQGSMAITVEVVSSSSKWAIGRAGEYPSYFDGYIDEFRFSKGIARWTTNFTPPTEPHTADAYTVLLLHFDGTDGSTSFIDDSALSPLANTKVNVGGAWKQVTDGYVNVGGIWKPINSIHTNIGGTWKLA